MDHQLQDSDLIADLAALEEWQRLPAAERKLSDKLRGVLAETACTGIIRYRWPLLRPLLVQLMLEQLTGFEAAEHVEVGPARPLLQSGDESVAAVAERFSSLLWSFTDAPWTLQRLCEVLLEPQKQYKRLHKLVLALEKLLLVTGEVPVTADPGPPPRLSQLAKVNEAPPSAAAAAAAAGAGAGAAASAGAAGAAASGQKRPRQEEADTTGLVTATLQIRQAPAAAPAAVSTAAPAAAAAPAAVVATEESDVATRSAEARENSLAASAADPAGGTSSSQPSRSPSPAAAAAADNVAAVGASKHQDDDTA